MDCTKHRSNGQPALRYFAAESARPSLLLLHGVTGCAEVTKLVNQLAPGETTAH